MTKQSFTELLNIAIGAEIDGRNIFDLFQELDKKGKLDSLKVYKILGVLIAATMESLPEKTNNSEETVDPTITLK